MQTQTSTPQLPASTPGYDDEARNNWHRYLYIKERGHIEYMAQAQRCEGMYLGAGLQWSDQDKAILTSAGRPFYEFNEVMPSVNAAIGHQIQNRMDISYKPRGGNGDLLKATALSKVVMQIADQNRLHWLETNVYGDGLIEQRGYYDLRMDFNKNIKGEIDIKTLDPRDVMPDPDAKSYDPDNWADVTVTRWLSLDEIDQLYGQKARDAADRSGDNGPDWGVADAEIERNKFGTTIMIGGFDAYNMESGIKRFRIVDRQRWVYQKTDCLVWPDTGDVKIAETLSDEEIAEALANGAVKAKRMQKRVKWVVSTYTATLFNEISPYEHFTIVPYFAYFRRGKTRGMVDNAIGPQEVLNKGVSQFIHILNTSANSGWTVEENSLTNMDLDELQEQGATTGLVIEHKKGAKPEKISPNQVPAGVADIIDRATQALKDVTVPDAMRGVQGGNAISGVAKQSDQFASQQQLAVPVDNLAFTRHMLALRLCKLVQRYYDSYRVFRITETDPTTGQQVEKTLEINKPMPDGGYFNDITIGTYDVVISEQPMAVTFEQSQYQQALEMKKQGIAIPDTVVVRYSSLADKAEIMAGMSNTDPLAEANANLINAKARQANSQAQALDVETIYSAVQAAGAITLNPAISQPADAILGSVGFQDHDAPPVVPMVNGAAARLAAPPGAPPNLQLPTLPAASDTHPNLPPTPAHADVGAHAGIETPQLQGAPA
jgi:hypothetical protein